MGYGLLRAAAKHFGGRRSGRDTAGKAYPRKERFALALKLLERKEPKLAAVALVNKIARVARKLMASGEHYRRPIEQAVPVMAA